MWNKNRITRVNNDHFSEEVEIAVVPLVKWKHNFVRQRDQFMTKTLSDIPLKHLFRTTIISFRQSCL